MVAMSSSGMPSGNLHAMPRISASHPEECLHKCIDVESLFMQILAHADGFHRTFQAQAKLSSTLLQLS